VSLTCSPERIARTRRALRPTFLASLFRQWSFVSLHPRGPPMATSMGRARSIAVNAADIAKLPADFDDLSIMEALMLLNMRRPTQKDTWQSTGSVARILAGKLVVARELEKMAAAPTREVSESDGRVDAVTSGRGESGRPAGGESLGRPSASDRGGSGALIGGVNAQPDSESVIVGISPAPGRAIANAPLLKSGRASI
jgi:hypothetical protein